jgi:hypothetical protein
LLDANIIIESHKVGVWEKLIEKVEIVVSSIVAHKEALFFSEVEGKIPEPINVNRLIQDGKIKDTLFCSSDGPAIQALAVIGHSGVGISIEMLLKETGLQKSLECQFSDAFFQKHLKKGAENLIQGVGISK